jgi:hypothetical protein
LQVYATSTGGLGGSAEGNTFTGGNGGNATAITTATSTAAANVGSFATATAGAGGVGSFGSVAGSSGLKALANATGTGNGGSITATASAAAGGLVNNIFARGIVPADTSLAHQTSQSIAQIGMSNAPTLATAAGSQIASFGIGQPAAADVANAWNNNPVVQGALGTPSNVQGMAIGSLQDPSGGSSASKVYTSLVGFTLTGAQVSTNDLLVGLIGSSTYSAGLGAGDTLSFKVTLGGSTVLTQAFTQISTAQNYFNDQLLDLGAENAKVSGGLLTLGFEYDLTSTHPGDGFGGELVFGAGGPVGIWNVAGGGAWGTNSNWTSNIVPQTQFDNVFFSGAITTASTVQLNTNWTAGNINFNNTNSYTLAAGSAGSLTLDNGNIASNIVDAGGDHTISAAMTLTSNLQVSVVGATNTMALFGNISGPGSFSLGGAGTAVLAGSNSYAGPTTASGGRLIIGSTFGLPHAGALVDNADVKILAGTAGAPVVTGRITGTGALSLGNGGGTVAYAQIASNTGTSTLANLKINAGSTLDISNNTLLINYGSAANDPVVSVVGALTSGFNGGPWTGTGLRSSTAAAGGVGETLSVGYADGNIDVGTPAGANQLVVKYTLAGDANLDGLVNFNDLVAVVQNFNKAGTDWAHGDFLYGASTNFNDLVAVVQNFNKVLTPAGSADVSIGGTTIALGQSAEVQSTAVELPEPCGMAVIGAGAAGLLARRRRRRV